MPTHLNEIQLVNERGTPTDECLRLNRWAETQGFDRELEAINLQYRRQGGIRFESMSPEDQLRCGGPRV